MIYKNKVTGEYIHAFKFTNDQDTLILIKNVKALINIGINWRQSEEILIIDESFNVSKGNYVTINIYGHPDSCIESLFEVTYEPIYIDDELHKCLDYVNEYNTQSDLNDLIQSYLFKRNRDLAEAFVAACSRVKNTNE